MKIEKVNILVIIVIFIFGCEKQTQEEEVLKYSIFTSAGDGGTVNFTNGLYSQGENLRIEAIAERGYVFNGWEGIDSQENVLEFSVQKSLSLKATFKLNVIELNSNVPYLVEDLVDNSGFILAIENGKQVCYLIDHRGVKQKTWNFELNLGQDAELAPDGSLYALFQVPNDNFGFGGKSGLIRKIGVNNEVLWEFQISSETEITHHDLELMPNGNLLVLLWYRIPKDEAQLIGFQSETDIYVEKIVEVNPSLNKIVWEWNSWDHIIQNVEPNHPTFGDPSLNRKKIDIFYNYQSDYHQFISKGDLMHANGLAYLESRDIIAVSVNFYNEVWFIDHSTTTEEAKGSSGGQFQNGGDLIYRFGNPKTFKDASPKILDLNHHPSFVSNQGLVNFMIFNNNNAEGKSKAMEFELPFFSNNMEIGPNPKIVFEYSNQDLFFNIVGSAMRLPNGNTLICEGDFGFWEVNSSGTLLWKYDGLGATFWRGIFYPKNSDAILNLNL